MKREYKHKLNMLEPGLKMCKAILVLFLAGFFLRAFSFKIIGMVMYIAAAVIGLLLLLLIVIEQYQDHQLYLKAKENDPDIK